ncbi:MAG: hypothetical protein LBL90_02125 [Prevotellaceae bacterium]|jgi:hypothetical protein|nr:hypothetical protein [Prevotellaceae bacterium]
MKRLSILIIFIIFSYTLFAQNEIKYSRYYISNKKIRALIDENIIISPRLQMIDFNALAKAPVDTIPYRTMLKTKEVAIKETYSHWRFGITGGYGLRIAPIPSKLSEDVIKRKKNLRNGFYVGTDAGHYVSENLGFGVKYNFFRASSSIDNFSGSLPYYENFTGKITDKVNVHYFAPSFMLRSVSRNKKIHANCDISIGYTTYTNNNTLNDKKYKIKGGNIGFSSTVGTDFLVSSDFAIGLTLSIVAASIKSFKIDGVKYSLNDDNIENLSRITFGLAFRLYK